MSTGGLQGPECVPEIFYTNSTANLVIGQEDFFLQISQQCTAQISCVCRMDEGAAWFVSVFVFGGVPIFGGILHLRPLDYQSIPMHLLCID